jgi:hypothetical protein
MFVHRVRKFMFDDIARAAAPNFLLALGLSCYTVSKQ